MAEDWTDEENDMIVADYFAMLTDDLCGRAYNKAEHNRGLQDRLGRTRGSIEFKYANVSAVARDFGQPILRGYLPRFNFQMSLAEAMERWLAANPEWSERLPKAVTGMAYAPGRLYLDTVPTQRNTPPPEELEQLQAIARRFDVAAREERNRALGKGRGRNAPSPTNAPCCGKPGATTWPVGSPGSARRKAMVRATTSPASPPTARPG